MKSYNDILKERITALERENAELKLKYVTQYDRLTLPAIQRLECWMKEITDLICYQPEVPMRHKTELCNALHAFRMELGPNPANATKEGK